MSVILSNFYPKKEKKKNSTSLIMNLSENEKTRASSLIDAGDDGVVLVH